MDPPPQRQFRLAELVRHVGLRIDVEAVVWCDSQAEAIWVANPARGRG